MADVTYPVIFSASMVQALLDGRKTQTRRLAWNKSKWKPGIECKHGHDACPECDIPKPSLWQSRHDKFQAGERPWLWVKETILWNGEADNFYFADGGVGTELYFKLRADKTGRKSRPSIHMRKKYSRLSLRVTDMRMERLQDISEEDARAEGIEKVRTPHTGWRHYQERDGLPGLTSQSSFSTLWNSIHGAGAWAANPECIVTQFEVHRENIERITHG